MAVAQAVPGTAAVDEILITSQLHQRARRNPDHAAENKALNELAILMVEQPAGLYQRFVDLAVDLCNAGSAGISVLETTPTGDIIFRWKALAGAFASYVEGTRHATSVRAASASIGARQCSHGRRGGSTISMRSVHSSPKG